MGKKKALERKKHSRKRMQFRDRCIDRCGNCPKLEKDVSIGRKPNVDIKKIENWRRKVYDS